MDIMEFEKEYRVHVYETGPEGKLNPYSLFNYFQDIASDHAEKLGFGREDLLRDNRFWVLSRMYAEITEMPGWKDTLKVKTWPNGTDKLFALRNFEVTAGNGKTIAAATSSWLILDRETKKVQRPDAVLSRFYSDLNPNHSQIRYATKLETTVNGTPSPVFRTKVSDLDINIHTNNVKYLSWVSDTYELDFVMKNRLVSAEINYLAESQFDEEILIMTSAEEMNNNAYNHSVFRTVDNRELCRIRLEWKDVDS